LAIDNSWNIVETKSVRKNLFGYRFYPDKLKGEGFFITALQKKGGSSFSYPKIKKQTTEKLNNKELELIKPWINNLEELYFFKHNDAVHVLPKKITDDLPILQSNLYFKKAGTIIGKLTPKELIPDHELALSTIINNEINAVQLSKEDAIQYLRKEEIKIDTTLKGWALARYRHQNLGWIKCLQNRINNYYPKEWRILKR
jgi:NOL1/NOP2/fmu family ribosome biogenesis protein